MILNEREDLDTWLDFAKLCRNGGNTALAERVLQMTQRMSNAFQFAHRAGSSASNEEMDRQIRLAVLKQKWAVGCKKDALFELEALIRNSWSLPTAASGPGTTLLNPLRGPTSPIGLPLSPEKSLDPHPHSLPPHMPTSSLFGGESAFRGIASGADSSFAPMAPTGSPTPAASSSSKDAAVHLECLLVLGEWKIAILGPDEQVDQVRRR